jgi:aspartate aminotransferase
MEFGAASRGGAFDAFPDVRAWFGRRYRGQSLTTSSQVSELLLADFRVAVIPGAPFGAEGFLRLSFATSPANIEKGVARIAAFAASLDRA